MKDKIITKQMLMLLTIFIMTIFSPCNGQNKTDMHKDDTVKLKVNIINMLPIGWGIKYKAVIEKIVDGSTQDFKDTIIFGITAKREYEDLKIGDTRLITFENSKKINKETYLPAINGTVSKLNEIWFITKIDKVINVDKKRIFVGTAMMSDGKPLFIWDFADSEAFYLDGLKSWDNKYLNKKITVEGVLIQNSVGESVIKDWEIIDSRTEEIQQKDDFNKIVKQIGNSLPNAWTIRMDTIQNNEFIIHSSVIDLAPNPFSNDPPNLKGQCAIYILMVPRISPDSINTIRERNRKLQEHLPPQNSKDNLRNWYKENEKILKILDSEPTHYDDNYSYRIKCQQEPKNEKDKKEYNKIMDYINKIFKHYSRIIRHPYSRSKK